MFVLLPDTYAVFETFNIIKYIYKCAMEKCVNSWCVSNRQTSGKSASLPQYNEGTELAEVAMSGCVSCKCGMGNRVHVIGK